MLSQSIWWIGMALEMLLLSRTFFGKLWRRYPVFYGYVSFVLLQSFLRFFFYEWDWPLYNRVYWTTEFLGLILGCWVVFEIYGVALAGYPGTARMARNVLTLFFVMALSRAMAEFWSNGLWPAGTSMLQIERALRTFQAVSIAALVSLFLFYAIPFGRNLRGILLGYSLFVGERVICLTFVQPTGTGFWFYAYSASYPVVLAIWILHLWSYEAFAETQKSVELEREYQLIAATTQRKLQEARGYLRKVVGS